MRFSKALPALFEAFQKAEIDFALIGGLAVYYMGIARATFDADFLVFLTDAERAEKLLTGLGYRQTHRTLNAACYSSPDPDQGRVDLLYAHRHYALEMLRHASVQTVLGWKVKILLPEDLIGLKVQSSSNDPDRMAKDLSDIESLMRIYKDQLDWSKVSEYFSVFGRETECEQLKAKAFERKQ